MPIESLVSSFPFAGYSIWITCFFLLEPHTMTNISVQTLNRLLPQTQCRECGYHGCTPYAEALVAGTAAINLCAPGGETVMLDLANALNQPPLAPVKIQPRAIAIIDETVCIGCTACIRACPTDAIMGAAKYMHTILTDECTGCGLCVPPCPVDCIDMVAAEDDYLPRNHFLSEQHESNARFAASTHAEQRYLRRNDRLKRNEEERRNYLAAKEAAAITKATHTPSANTTTIPNSADLIAKAMARAQAQQTKQSVPTNRDRYRETRLKEAQEKAAYRRALRDVQYGNENEKAAALAWLREHKTTQEANVTEA